MATRYYVRILEACIERVGTAAVPAAPRKGPTAVELPGAVWLPTHSEEQSHVVRVPVEGGAFLNVLVAFESDRDCARFIDELGEFLMETRSVLPSPLMPRLASVDALVEMVERLEACVVTEGGAIVFLRPERCDPETGTPL